MGVSPNPVTRFARSINFSSSIILLLFLRRACARFARSGAHQEGLASFTDIEIRRWIVRPIYALGLQFVEHPLALEVFG